MRPSKKIHDLMTELGEACHAEGFAFAVAFLHDDGTLHSAGNTLQQTELFRACCADSKYLGEVAGDG